MTPRKGKVLAIVVSAASVVFIIVMCAVGGAFGGGDDPTDYIHDHYTRASNLDRYDGTSPSLAYTSTSSQHSVVSDLRGNTDELDHARASSVDFLQYGEHIVAVEDDGVGGALIYIDDYRSGYRRYASGYSTFAFFGWSSSPPGSSGFLGGGGGFGK